MTSWLMTLVIAELAILTALVAFPRTPLKTPLRCLRLTRKETSTNGILALAVQSPMQLGGHSMIMRSYLKERLYTCHPPGILRCWKVFRPGQTKNRSCTARKKASNLFCWMMITVIVIHLWALVTLCVGQAMIPGTAPQGNMAWIPCTTHIVMCRDMALDLPYTSVQIHELIISPSHSIYFRLCLVSMQSAEWLPNGTLL